jgi:hypothetical protein
MASLEPILFLPSFSTPRPNGSPALARTVEAVQAWLEREGVPVHRLRFTLRPYLMELLGLWMPLLAFCYLWLRAEDGLDGAGAALLG